MEDLMKVLPKEAQQAIEEVPMLQEIVEPEPQGIGWGVGFGLVGLVAIFAAAFVKYKCKK